MIYRSITTDDEYPSRDGDKLDIRRSMMDRWNASGDDASDGASLPSLTNNIRTLIDFIFDKCVPSINVSARTHPASCSFGWYDDQRPDYGNGWCWFHPVQYGRFYPPLANTSARRFAVTITRVWVVVTFGDNARRLCSSFHHVDVLVAFDDAMNRCLIYASWPQAAAHRRHGHHLRADAFQFGVGRRYHLLRWGLSASWISRPVM